MVKTYKLLGNTVAYNHDEVLIGWPILAELNDGYLVLQIHGGNPRMAGLFQTSFIGKDLVETATKLSAPKSTKGTSNE